MMASYNSYERGVAREAAGDAAGAILHLERFVDAVDKPPPAFVARVADAEARLRRLAGADR
jgi:hypothetical protein